MKILFNTGINHYQPAFGSRSRIILPKIEADSFSVLDKYEKKYARGYLCDLIPDLKEFLRKFNYVKESDIKGILGECGLSVVFDAGEKGALKCSLENLLEYRKHCPDFDIPFLSPVIKVNKTYIVQQPKAETDNLGVEDCRDVIARIKKAGFELSRDMDEYKTRQIGRYNGKNYLLDSRCAVPCPNRFSRFVYDFCQNHRRVFMLRDMSNSALDSYEREMFRLAKTYGPQVLHVGEAPRKNLSLSEGISMIIELMKENMKYTKFPF